MSSGARVSIPNSVRKTIQNIRRSRAITVKMRYMQCSRNVLWIPTRPPRSSSFRVVLAAQLVCWTGQFIGHGVFEKRAPALLDNLSQAFLMAPFFVLLEALQSFFGYEPYPGFHVAVQAKIDAEIKEWQDKKQKLIS